MAEEAAQPKEDAQPKKVEKAGVVVKINPLLGITKGGVGIPGHGHFRGGERISKAQFNKLEKEACHRPTSKSPEGFPLLIEDKEEE